MLLADLHIHTTWSDGCLSLPDVVDLFGRKGHDVIAITDHIVPAHARWQAAAASSKRNYFGVVAGNDAGRASDRIDMALLDAGFEVGEEGSPGFAGEFVIANLVRRREGVDTESVGFTDRGGEGAVVFVIRALLRG